jgi:serine/threonine protein kinase
MNTLELSTGMALNNGLLPRSQKLTTRVTPVFSDIKPENLLFFPIPFVPSKHPKPTQPGDEEKVDEGEFIPGVGAGGIGTIKVADFGLSKVIWDSETMTPCGTVGYTAPEIVKDERYSKSVDMWALGCVLYTLLCGFPPFYDESIQALTEKVARGQYTFLSPWWDDISKSAQDLISHLLTVDPDKRIDIKEFLNHPWIRQTTEETTPAADAPPLATPFGMKSQQHLDQALTPAGDKRYDFRSPGAMNLREVFDVGYAVHRQEEENKRRKNFRHGYRGANPPLNPLNEFDDDDEDYEEIIYYDQDNNASLPSKVPRGEYSPAEVAVMENKMRATNLGSQPSAAAQARQAHVRSSKPSQQQQQQYAQQQQQQALQQQQRQQQQPQQQRQQQQQQQQQRQSRQGGYGQHSAAVAAAARQNAARTAEQPFELSLDNATLLERRHRRIGGSIAT